MLKKNLQNKIGNPCNNKDRSGRLSSIVNSSFKKIETTYQKIKTT